ncbi:MAG: putative molybdenum carrier protein [bacterium]
MNKPHQKLFICSGGQTGIDRAALDCAEEMKIISGGWCPRGRRAEDGTISGKYLMMETSQPYYWKRTWLNVIQSDATLIIMPQDDTNSRGTHLTVKYARKALKPFKILVLDKTGNDEIVQWLNHIQPKILNIAGPRESNYPGIYQHGKKVLRQIFKAYLLC